MRALGPGSVASLLKIALDVVYVAIGIGVVAVALSTVGLLFYLPFAPGNAVFSVEGHSISLASRLPRIVVLALLIEAYLASVMIILNRLRLVFATLTRGDPFQPENVGRLRIVGLALIGLEAAGWLVRLAFLWAAPEAPSSSGLFAINLTSWFAVMAVFVLAEVFREGARLRTDAELTI